MSESSCLSQIFRGRKVSTVNVGGAAGVVAREDGLIADNTLFVTGLDTTQESLVQVGLVVVVSVGACNNTGVDTGGVAVPEVGVDARNGCTSVDINQLDVKMQGHTNLVFD